MKQLPDYANLVKSNVVEAPKMQKGKPDLRKLTQEQFLELRKNNPEALGLKRR